MVSHRTGDRLISALVLQSVAFIVVSAMGALTTKMLSQHFGAVNFGEWGLATACFSILSLIADSGAFQLTQREVARHPAESEDVVNFAVGIRLALTLFVMPVGAVFVLLAFSDTHPLAVGLFLVYCVSLPPQAVVQIVSAYFAADLRLYRVSQFQVLRTTVFACGVFLTTSNNWPLLVCAVFDVAGLFAVLVAMWSIAAKEIDLRPRFSFERAKANLSEAFPIGLNQVLAQLYRRIDILILSMMVTTRDIGWYAGAFFIVGPSYAIATILNRVTAPRLASAIYFRRRFATESMETFAVVGSCLCVVLVAGAPCLVSFFLGSDFRGSVFSLEILACGLPLAFVNICASTTIVAFRGSHKLFVVALIGLVGNIVLNLVFIPSFGIEGSATATIACELLQLPVFLRILRQMPVRHYRIFSSIWKAGIALLMFTGMLAANFWLNLVSDGAARGLAILAFCFALIALRGFPNELSHAIRNRT